MRSKFKNKGKTNKKNKKNKKYKLRGGVKRYSKTRSSNKRYSKKSKKKLRGGAKREALLDGGEWTNHYFGECPEDSLNGGKNSKEDDPDGFYTMGSAERWEKENCNKPPEDYKYNGECPEDTLNKGETSSAQHPKGLSFADAQQWEKENCNISYDGVCPEKSLNKGETSSEKHPKGLSLFDAKKWVKKNCNYSPAAFTGFQLKVNEIIEAWESHNSVKDSEGVIPGLENFIKILTIYSKLIEQSNWKNVILLLITLSKYKNLWGEKCEMLSAEVLFDIAYSFIDENKRLPGPRGDWGGWTDGGKNQRDMEEIPSLWFLFHMFRNFDMSLVRSGLGEWDKEKNRMKTNKEAGFGVKMGIYEYYEYQKEMINEITDLTDKNFVPGEEIIYIIPGNGGFRKGLVVKKESNLVEINTNPRYEFTKKFHELLVYKCK